MNTFTELDCIDLQLINWLAKADYKKKKLCYQLKGILLQKFAVDDGFDLQEFTRPCWTDDEYGSYRDTYYEGETYSWHSHILQRHKVGDHIFHSPTDQFLYSNINNVTKQSDWFDIAKAQCKGKIEEIKEVPTGFDKNQANKALRRIVHKFKPLFRETITKPERAKFPFIKIKYWSYSKEFDEFVVRVPGDIACACGLKLTVHVSSWQLAKMKIGTFDGFRHIDCDYEKDYPRKVEDCPNYIIRIRKEVGRPEYRNLTPYEKELEKVSEWAKEFFLKHWDEFKETMTGIEAKIVKAQEKEQKESVLIL